MSDLILLTGSICLSDLNLLARSGHAAFTKAKNGKIYCSAAIWLRDEPDEFKNHASMQLNARDAERPYIGNFRRQERQPTAEDLLGLPEDDDLPF